MIDTTTIRRTPACSPACCRLLFRRRAGGHVDDAFHARQRGCEALAGDDVHAARTRDRDDVVPLRLQYFHDMPADPPGRSGYRNLHVTAPCQDLWLSFATAMTDCGGRL